MNPMPPTTDYRAPESSDLLGSSKKFLNFMQCHAPSPEVRDILLTNVVFFMNDCVSRPQGSRDMA